MARQKGFRLVEVVGMLTEITGMLSTAIRKAGGETVDQNQLFTDLQDLVKRYGSQTETPPAMASAQDEEQPEVDYNLAVDLLAGAVLNQQTGNTQKAWTEFQAACSAVGIEQVLEAFATYNDAAMDVGVDPTVTDNQETDSEHEAPPPSEDDDAGEDTPTDAVKSFMDKRKSRMKADPETVALANKLSQDGSPKYRALARRHFIKK